MERRLPSEGCGRQAIFHRDILAPRLWVVAEQPPDGGSSQRVGSVVYIIRDGRQRPLLYVEYKRTGMNPRQQHAAWQVNKYYRELLHADREVTEIRAMLCYGTQAKAWNVRPRVNASKVKSYDTADNKDGELAGALERVRIAERESRLRVTTMHHLITLHCFFRDTGYSTSYDKTDYLPSHRTRISRPYSHSANELSSCMLATRLLVMVTSVDAFSPKVRRR